MPEEPPIPADQETGPKDAKDWILFLAELQRLQMRQEERRVLQERKDKQNEAE